MGDDKIREFAEKKFGKINVIVSLYSLQIVWADRKFADMVDFKEEELPGKNIRDIIVIDYHVFLRTLGKFLGKTADDTKILKRKDGKKIKASGTVHHFSFEKEEYICVRLKKAEHV